MLIHQFLKYLLCSYYMSGFVISTGWTVDLFPALLSSVQEGKCRFRYNVLIVFYVANIFLVSIFISTRGRECVSTGSFSIYSFHFRTAPLLVSQLKFIYTIFKGDRSRLCGNEAYKIWGPSLGKRIQGPSMWENLPMSNCLKF